ncbi:MAG TPA: hypothetical protein EYP21_06915 [Syntrophaceae bacterium]|nr:hypothetical protein [Syntrophaceae bacterium]
MISVEDIKRLSAERKVHEIIIEKDYILDWILFGLSKFPKLRNNLVFKGGTTLHKFYFTDWRFSEDLDFTTINQITERDLTDVLPELCEIVHRSILDKNFLFCLFHVNLGASRYLLKYLWVTENLTHNIDCTGRTYFIPFADGCGAKKDT